MVSEDEERRWRRIWRDVRICWLILAYAFWYVVSVARPFSNGLIRSIPEFLDYLVRRWLPVALLMTVLFLIGEAWRNRRAKKLSERGAVEVK